MLSINTNIISLNAQNNLSNTQSALGTSLARLSSGLRINSAADDAAGYSIANRFTAQINGLNQATRNANDGVSLAQTANGGLQSIQNNLQTIRNLAVQSANGSNSSIDRSSLQAQASQLLQEIDRVAKSTQFNGVNLLDGSFSSQFQVGSNVGQTVNIAIGSAQSKDLGTGATSAVTMDGTTSTTALAYGDLVVNGVTVNAPTSSMDNASTTYAANSAIAKAAAINSVSSQTGVTATVETNTMAGGNMTATTIGTTGSLTINGVSIGTVAEGSSTASTRSSIIAAINAKSAETGVVAVDSGNDHTGISLTAADGRNINVQTAATGLTAAQMGLTSGTHIGAVALQSTSAINITSNTNGLKNWGLVAGTYNTATAYVSATGTGTTTALTSGDVTINGVAVGDSLASSDTASYTLASASAIAKAAAINSITAQTGVTATANANTVIGASLVNGTAALSTALTLNGVSIGTFTTTANATTDRNTLINQINQYSGQTGVVASVDNVTGGLDMTAADGRNIDLSIGATSTMTAAQVGLGSIYDGSTGDKVQVGTVSLKSASAITVGTTTTTGTTNLGIDVGTYGSVKNGVSLSRMDISTVAGANTALTAIDNAISQVNSQAGALGAYQNRFTATVSNLQSTAQNLTAARSQIQDTDFASETANLSRNQILQQAGTAMLAQANQMGQSVLSLLK
jgi:flagellin